MAEEQFNWEEVSLESTGTGDDKKKSQSPSPSPFLGGPIGSVESGSDGPFISGTNREDLVRKIVTQEEPKKAQPKPIETFKGELPKQKEVVGDFLTPEGKAIEIGKPVLDSETVTKIEQSPAVQLQKAKDFKVNQYNEKKAEFVALEAEANEMAETLQIMADAINNGDNSTPEAILTAQQLQEELKGRARQLDNVSSELEQLGKEAYITDLVADKEASKLKQDKDVSMTEAIVRSSTKTFVDGIADMYGMLSDLTRSAEDIAGWEKGATVSNYLKGQSDLANQLSTSIEDIAPDEWKSFTENPSLDSFLYNAGKISLDMLPMVASSVASGGSSLAAFVPSMIQNSGGLYREIKKAYPDADPTAVALLSLTVGAGIAKIDMINLPTLTTGAKNIAIKSMTDDVLKAISEKGLTKQTINELSEVSGKSLLKNLGEAGTQIRKAGVEEAAMEVGQDQIANIAKEGVDIAMEGDKFNNDLKEYGAQVLETALFSGVTGSGYKTLSTIQDLADIDKSDIDYINEIGNSPEMLQQLDQKIELGVKGGLINPEQAENIKANVKAIAEINTQISNDISDDAKVAAINLIRDKSLMEKQLESTPKELQPALEAKIKDAQETITKILGNEAMTDEDIMDAEYKIIRVPNRPPVYVKVVDGKELPITKTTFDFEVAKQDKMLDAAIKEREKAIKERQAETPQEQISTPSGTEQPVATEIIPEQVQEVVEPTQEEVTQQVDQEEVKVNKYIDKLNSLKVDPNGRTFVAFTGIEPILAKVGIDAWNSAVDIMVKQIQDGTKVGQAIINFMGKIDEFMGGEAYDRNNLKSNLETFIQEEEDKRYKNFSNRLRNAIDKFSGGMISDAVLAGQMNQGAIGAEQLRTQKEKTAQRIEALKEKAKTDKKAALEKQKYELEMRRLIQQEAFNDKVTALKEKYKGKIEDLKFKQEYRDLLRKEKEDAKKELRESITEMLQDKEVRKKINSSDVTNSKLIGMVNKINTQKQLDNFVAFINKAMDDSTFLGKYDKATSIQDKLKKLSKDNSINNTARDLAKQISTIDIDNMSATEIDKFTKLFENVATGLSKSKLIKGNVIRLPSDFYEIKNNIDLFNQKSKPVAEKGVVGSGARRYIDDPTVEAINAEFKKQKDYYENLYNNGKINKDYYDAQISRLESDAEIEISEAVQNKQAEIGSMANDSKQYLEDFKRDIYNDLTDTQKKVVDELLDADIESLNTNDRLAYIDAIDNIIVNQSFSKAGMLSDKILAKNQLQELKGLEPEIKKEFTWLGKFVQEEFKNKISQYEAYTKSKDAALKLMKAVGFDKITLGAAKVKSIMNEFMSDVDNVIDKYDKRGVDLNRADSRVRRGVYAFLKQTTANTPEEAQAEFENKVRYLFAMSNAMVDNKYDNKNQAKKGELYLSVLNSLDLLGKTSDEFNAEFNKKYPGETEIVDLAIKFGEDHKQEFLDYGDIYAGKNPDPITFYTPTRTEAILDEKISDKPENVDLLTNMMSRDNVSISESKSLLSRTNLNPDNVTRTFNLDFDNVVEKAYKEQLYSSTLQQQAKATSRVLASNELNSLLGSENVKTLKKSLEHKIKVDLGLNFNDSPGASKGVRALDTIVGRQAQYVLGSVGQFLKQATVLADTATQYLGSLNYIMGTTKGGFDLPDSMKSLMLNAPIAQRSIDAMYKGRIDVDAINDLEKDSDSMLSKAAKLEKTIREKGGEMAYAPLKKTDQWAAQVGWLSAYAEYLRRNGTELKDIDWNKEAANPNEDAMMFAELETTRAQSISDKSLSANLLSNDDTYKSVIKNILFGFASFSINAKDRLYTDLSRGDYRSAVGAAAGAVAFTAAAQSMNAIIPMLYEKAAEYFFDVSAEEEDKEKKGFKYWAATVVSNTLEDMFVSGIPGLNQLYKAGANKTWEYINSSEMTEIEANLKLIDTQLKSAKSKEKEGLMNQKKDLLAKKKALESLNVLYKNSIKSQYGNYSLISDRLQRTAREFELTGNETFENGENIWLWGLILTDLAAISGYGQADLAKIKNNIFKAIDKKAKQEAIKRKEEKKLQGE